MCRRGRRHTGRRAPEPRSAGDRLGRTIGGDPYSRSLARVGEHLPHGQFLVLGSTVCPGVTPLAHRAAAALGLDLASPSAGADCRRPGDDRTVLPAPTRGWADRTEPREGDRAMPDIDRDYRSDVTRRG